MTNFAEEAMSDPAEYNEDGFDHVYEFDIPNHLEGTTLHWSADPDDYISMTLTNVTDEQKEIIEQKLADPTLVGGRGKTRKTHTGVIDAIHRTLGNLHSHSKDGGIIRKTKPTDLGEV